MKATFAVVFVATLLLIPLASTAAVAGGEAGAPATAAPAPVGVAATDAQPPAEWLFACVPQCSYYQGICQEECSGLGGIKSFSCTPPPPGICAHFTCVCNRGL
jgi:hypothetical protein